MQQVTCGVIQDLLISYCDGLSADNVAEMIQEHLKKCPECRRKYEEILRGREQEEQSEIFRGRQFRRKLISLRYYMVGGVIGIISPIVLLILWFLVAEVKSYIEIMFYSYFI